MFNQKEKGDSLQHNQIAIVDDFFDFWIMEDHEGSQLDN